MISSPTERDKQDVLNAADDLRRAENAAAAAPNDAEKAAAALRARVAMTETTLRIGKRLAQTDEDKAQLKLLEANFEKAKAELAVAHDKLTTSAKAKASLMSFASKKYAGVPVYGWAAIVGAAVYLGRYAFKRES